MNARHLRPYPAYRDSGVEWLGEIPQHWTLQRTKRLMWERSSKGFPDEPLLAATQTRGVVRKEEYEHRTVLALQDLHLLKLVCERDFVISLRSFQGGIEYARQRGIISPAYTVLRPRDETDHAYLACLFKSRPYIDQLRLCVTGIRQGQNVDYEKLARSPLPYPPHTEQTAIARFLSHADRRIRRAIRAKEQLIALLGEQKQALIHDAVTGRTDVRTGQPYPTYKDSGVEWLGEVPEHWEVGRLKALLCPVDQRSNDGKETLLSLRRDHGVVIYAEHFAHPPQARSLVGYKQVRAGELVVNRLQANNGLVFNSTLNGLVSPDYSVFESKVPVQMRYLSDLLRTPVFRAHFRRQSTGLGTGTAGFLRVYDDDFLGTRVALPSIDEQAAIVAHLDDATSTFARATRLLRSQIERLKEYRTRLIADVVTGKLDVREAAASLPDEDAPPAGEEWHAGR